MDEPVEVEVPTSAAEGCRFIKLLNFPTGWPSSAESREALAKSGIQRRPFVCSALKNNLKPQGAIDAGKSIANWILRAAINVFISQTHATPQFWLEIFENRRSSGQLCDSTGAGWVAQTEQVVKLLFFQDIASFSTSKECHDAKTSRLVFPTVHLGTERKPTQWSTFRLIIFFWNKSSPTRQKDRKMIDTYRTRKQTTTRQLLAWLDVRIQLERMLVVDVINVNASDLKFSPKILDVAT